ncbi:MAG: DUF3369 domain-containing protein [Desulfobacteraceae bacterium]
MTKKIKTREEIENELLFADEEIKAAAFSRAKGRPWKILVADDEKEIHEITRIALQSYTFEERPVELHHAFSGRGARKILEQEKDIALILLDVVMERDDSGLALVRYIREELGNSVVRILLRTGQPGKAPEQEVIARYDINDYKAKTELTAQKLFTAVTASLRGYSNLRLIEHNRIGLKRIIDSTASIFKATSVYHFASGVLAQLLGILKPDSDAAADFSSAYAVSFFDEEMKIVAGTGKYAGRLEEETGKVLPGDVLAEVETLKETGGDLFSKDMYVGVFKTSEGATSLLYLSGCRNLSAVDRNLVRIYTNSVSIGFDNVSLAREIIDTQKEVIYTLGEIVETRSKETANHVTRVAEVCYRLARRYGMDEKSAEMLKLASPMHDIGKIGIPEAILHKPGKLTNEEFDIIKTHAEMGYDILKNSRRQIMKTAAIVALQHHEKWDGTGYPRKLAGENIHIYGRIAAIADVFDALTHERCYKEAWSLDRVKALFARERGRHFDPRLMDLFLSDLDSFVAINRIFPD